MSENLRERLGKYFRSKLDSGMPANSSFATGNRELERDWSKFEQRLDLLIPQTPKKDYRWLVPFALLALLALLWSLYSSHQNKEALEHLKADLASRNNHIIINDTIVKTIVIYKYDTITQTVFEKDKHSQTFIDDTEHDKDSKVSTRRLSDSHRNLSSAASANDSNSQISNLLSPQQGAQIPNVSSNVAHSNQNTPSSLAPTPEIAASITLAAKIQMKDSGRKRESTKPPFSSPNDQAPMSSLPLYHPLTSIEHSRSSFTDSLWASLASPVIQRAKKNTYPLLPIGFRLGVSSHLEVVKNYIIDQQGCYGFGLTGEIIFPGRFSLNFEAVNIGNRFVRGEYAINEYPYKWQAPWGYKISSMKGDWRYWEYSTSLKYYIGSNKKWLPYIGAGMSWQRDLPFTASYSIYELSTRIESAPVDKAVNNTNVRNYLNFQLGLLHPFNHRYSWSVEANYGKRTDNASSESAEHYGVSSSLFYHF